MREQTEAESLLMFVYCVCVFVLLQASRSLSFLSVFFFQPLKDKLRINSRQDDADEVIEICESA